jgi:hypothetical protein
MQKTWCDGWDEDCKEKAILCPWRENGIRESILLYQITRSYCFYRDDKKNAEKHVYDFSAKMRRAIKK